jgi:hypothetical protein
MSAGKRISGSANRQAWKSASQQRRHPNRNRPAPAARRAEVPVLLPELVRPLVSEPRAECRDGEARTKSADVGAVARLCQKIPERDGNAGKLTYHRAPRRSLEADELFRRLLLRRRGPLPSVGASGAAEESGRQSHIARRCVMHRTDQVQKPAGCHARAARICPCRRASQRRMRAP